MGIKPDDFWRFTPAEFMVMAEGYDRKKRDKINELLYLAWHTAVFSRMTKIPKLKDVLIEEKKHVEPKQAQTPEQMATACKLLTAALGGQIIEVS